MASYNRVILMGRVGTDPESKDVNGKTMIRFRLATSNVQFNPQENRYETIGTDWHTIIMWGERAERASQSIKKGDLVLVEGQLRTREWTTQDGQKRVSVEVVADTYRKIMSGRGASQQEVQEEAMEHPFEMSGEDTDYIDPVLRNNLSSDDLPEGSTEDDLPF